MATKEELLKKRGNRVRGGKVLECIVCGNNFYRKPSHINRSKYCSLECAYEDRKGVKFSGEHKRKLSEAKKGKIFTEEHRKNMSIARTGKPNYKRRGLKHSEKTKKKISEAHNGKTSPFKGISKYKTKEEKRLADLLSGKKSYRKHIETRLIHYRQLAFKRRNAKGSFTKEEWDNKLQEYNYKCVICDISHEELLNLTGMGLTIDHIVPISKGGTSYIKNLQPLCKKCNCKKGNKYVKGVPLAVVIQ